MEDIFWSLFHTTGSPAAYLLYKEMSGQGDFSPN